MSLCYFTQQCRESPSFCPRLPFNNFLQFHNLGPSWVALEQPFLKTHLRFALNNRRENPFEALGCRAECPNTGWAPSAKPGISQLQALWEEWVNTRGQWGVLRAGSQRCHIASSVWSWAFHLGWLSKSQFQAPQFVRNLRQFLHDRNTVPRTPTDREFISLANVVIINDKNPCPQVYLLIEKSFHISQRSLPNYHHYYFTIEWEQKPWLFREVRVGGFLLEENWCGNSSSSVLESVGCID